MYLFRFILQQQQQQQQQQLSLFKDCFIRVDNISRDVNTLSFANEEQKIIPQSYIWPCETKPRFLFL